MEQYLRNILRILAQHVTSAADKKLVQDILDHLDDQVTGDGGAEVTNVAPDAEEQPTLSQILEAALTSAETELYLRNILHLLAQLVTSAADIKLVQDILHLLDEVKAKSKFTWNRRVPTRQLPPGGPAAPEGPSAPVASASPNVVHKVLSQITVEQEHTLFLSVFVAVSIVAIWAVLFVFNDTNLLETACWTSTISSIVIVSAVVALVKRQQLPAEITGAEWVLFWVTLATTITLGVITTVSKDKPKRRSGGDGSGGGGGGGGVGGGDLQHTWRILLRVAVGTALTVLVVVMAYIWFKGSMKSPPRAQA
jgi:lysylphosphatidylglycerol synthetase-like protein (DUF2156 family)